MGQLHPAGSHELAQARVVACDTSSEVVGGVRGVSNRRQGHLQRRETKGWKGFAPLGLQASGYCVLGNDVERAEERSHCGTAIPGKKLLRVRFISRAMQGKQAQRQEQRRGPGRDGRRFRIQGSELTPSSTRKRTCNASDAVQQRRGAGVGRHCAAGCRLVSAEKVV